MDIEPHPDGLTVLHGPNGAGKTSVLEAIGWVATLGSFRGASRETVIRRGVPSAVLRAETDVEGYSAAIELEIRADRCRALLNRQPVRRRSDLSVALRMSLFAPSDIRLVEGGPVERRDHLDAIVAAGGRRLESVVSEVNNVLRQRAALLRRLALGSDTELLTTLEVWDSRLSRSGAALVTAREEVVAELEPVVNASYRALSDDETDVTLTYRRSWQGELSDALAAARAEDIAKQVTTVGPHRDEIEIRLGDEPVRTHGSQGEQRCVALALQLAAHELSRRRAPEPPVLLLDDVFSELDATRCAALLELLPRGQVLLTTAVDPPSAVGADRVIELRGGRVVSATSAPS